MNIINIYSADKPANVSNKRMIKKLLIELFKQENAELDTVNYVFCSDEYLSNINIKYLNHSNLTDVITFPLSSPGNAISGEIYLSTERIKENAKLFDVKYQNELLRVMIHGALHLCGYTDKTKSFKLQMRHKENYYLNQFNVSREANS